MGVLWRERPNGAENLTAGRGSKSILLTFDRIIRFRTENGLGPLLTVGENTAQGVFEWWLTDAATEKVDENQLDMWAWETDFYIP